MSKTGQKEKEKSKFTFGSNERDSLLHEWSTHVFDFSFKPI